MENIKEEKAREYDEKHFDDKSDEGKRHWALKGFKAGFEAGKQERDLPDIELVSAKVHEAWIESKKAQGVTSRKSEKGEELMVPYGDLSEEAKDLDRVTVKTVYKALENLSK